MTNHKIKISVLLIALILMLTFTPASILATMQTDKTILAENEIALLTIKIHNDSPEEAKNIILSLKGDEAIRFLEDGEENITIAKQIDQINPKETKEIQIKIKSISSKKPNSNIYLYYGTSNPPTTAAVTSIETKESPIVVSTNFEKKTVESDEIVSIEFKLTNNSEENITRVGVEMIPPRNYQLITLPIFAEVIPSGAAIEQKFEAKIPFDAKGEQKITLAYGYFDDANTPHYFEKNFTTTINKTNYQLIALIAFGVLVVALYLFFKKDSKTGIKGTEKK